MKFYLSFVHELDDCDQFAGACVVEADSVEEAVLEAHRRGCNPGGQVLIVELGQPLAGDPTLSLELNRLYTAEELNAVEIKSIRQWEDEAEGGGPG